MKQIIQTHEDERPVPRIPEKKLWAAVLVQAFKDLERLQAGAANAVNIHRNNAIAWVASSRVDYIGSFLWVCEVLDLNPDVVRAVFRNGKLNNKLLITRKQGIMSRIRDLDPEMFKTMSALEIAAMFNTTKYNIYNVMSILGIEYRHRHRGGNHRTKKLLTSEL